MKNGFTRGRMIPRWPRALTIKRVAFCASGDLPMRCRCRGRRWRCSNNSFTMEIARKSLTVWPSKPARFRDLNRRDEARSVTDEEQQMRKRIASATALPGQSNKILVN